MKFQHFQDLLSELEPLIQVAFPLLIAIATAIILTTAGFSRSKPEGHDGSSYGQNRLEQVDSIRVFVEIQ
ncbi:MAG: hypothetical protein OXR72_15750 [Gemmatimonadota bacterium]|nr:hypothetical protein [Gemmatimonadota bacterium]